jgi:hypothetical protein
VDIKTEERLQVEVETVGEGGVFGVTEYSEELGEGVIDSAVLVMGKRAIGGGAPNTFGGNVRQK